MLFPEFQIVELAPGALLLRGAAEACATDLLSQIEGVILISPLRTVATPMGKSMSVEMTNCGDVGWVSDRTGYRYETIDPVTNSAWPTMPSLFAELASRAAAQAGFPEFHPDACLINRYAAGSIMGLHQVRDEQVFTQPIVSVSLGLPINFKFGGSTRNSPTTKIELRHGDAVVFGGLSRLAFHGVGTLRRGQHPLAGPYRFNLTFRRTG
jgi:alkylated DNA repair protein (DNA oxidative demethylase)